MRERPHNERCNLCGEWHKEGIENYAEHLKNCKREKESLFDNQTIDDYSCRGNPYNNEYPVSCADGLTQVFAVYIKSFAKTSYDHRKIVHITRIGGLVSLESFYDLGRIPLTIGWGNGRVAWIGQKGSKWLTFHTWDGFRWRVLDRDNGLCQMCGKSVASKIKDGKYAGLWNNDTVFVCDHITPLCKGGKDWHEDPEMRNFQTLCEKCNKIKTKADMESHLADKRLQKHIGKKGFTLLEFPVSNN